MSLDEAWKNAQQLQVGMDLVRAAKVQLTFLAAVHANMCLFDTRVLDRAIARYEFCWLPLVANSGENNLVPPLDCAWIWHCHKLNPVQYTSDCEKLFGRLIDGSLSDLDNEFTKNLWEENYIDEPYYFDPCIHFGRRYSDRQRDIEYNLQEAVFRQKSFFYQVSEPHYLNDVFLAAAVTRYKAFLYILKKNNDQGKSDFCVPTYDIDLMWHTHQLNAVCYREDMVHLFGRVLEHDDTDSNRAEGGKLDVGYSTTAALWFETFKSLYGKAGCMYRGEESCFVAPHQQFTHGTLSSLQKSPSYTWLQHQQHYLKTRHIMKVHVEVKLTGASDGVPIPPSLFFRLETQHNCARIETRVSGIQERHSWSLECEASTNGIGLQLRSRVWKSKKHWSMDATWEEVLLSSQQSHSSWIPVQMKKGMLGIYATITATPPVKGPYLFRSVSAKATNNACKAIKTPFSKHKHWMTRTVLDHQNNEAYIIRARCHKDHETVLVHQGGWKYGDGTRRVAGNVVGDARQKSASSWSMLADRLTLTIEQGVGNDWNLHPSFTLTGSTIVLLSGRKLQFEVLDAREKEEAGFVTLVRFTAEAPMGVATALFNWKSGYMEINPEEHVVLVLLLCTVICISVTEMLGKDVASLNIKGRSARGKHKSGDFGGVVCISNPRMQAWWMRLGSLQMVTSASCGAGVCGVDTSGSGGCGGSCGDLGCGGGCGVVEPNK